jgi:capsular exopolysaccharide synthesis family protein
LSLEVPIISFPEAPRQPGGLPGQPDKDAGANSPAQRGEDAGLAQIPIEPLEIESSSRIVLITDPRSPSADRFRALRMSLRELRKSSKLKSLVITSALPEDGKSTVALNLATVLAEGGRNSVLLIEADLYRGGIASTLKIPPQAGLAECLESGLNPMLAIRRLEPLQWYLLQAGEPRGNPTELLQSPSAAQLLDSLAAYFDWILLDTPPVAPLSDALSLARHVDGTLLVVRAGRTDREAVDEAVSRLGPNRIAGIVFNGAEKLSRNYHKYYKYYANK